MKKLLGLIIKITFGFLLCACGTVMALNSNLGLSPWDVFHQGLTNVTGLTMGQASIVVGNFDFKDLVGKPFNLL